MHIEELHDLYSSPNIIRMIKSRRMRWACYAECMSDMKHAHKTLLGSLKGRDYSEDLGADSRIILKRFVGK
jgi:hypothetical protein